MTTTCGSFSETLRCEAGWKVVIRAASPFPPAPTWKNNYATAALLNQPFGRSAGALVLPGNVVH